MPSGSEAVTFNDPDTVTFTVPEGEIWYVDSAGYDSDDDAGGQVMAVRLRVAVVSSKNPMDRRVNQFSRSADDTDPDATGSNLILGAYAYGGETVVVAIDGTSSSGTGFLNARRVL